MDEEQFIVFYAWQSDSPSSVNRNFIESAATKALKRMKGIIDASPRLDKDTKDVPGIPDIANTILDKIKGADLFLADLTYIGAAYEHEDANEPIPNPNVMIETGYDLAELGSERIVTVINTYYGKQEQLPFDLRNRRWPIAYELSPEADQEQRREQQESLAGRLSEAFASIAEVPPREKQQSLEQRVIMLERMVTTLSTGDATQQINLATLVEALKGSQPSGQQDEISPQKECEDSRALLISRINEGKFEELAPDVSRLIITIIPALPQPSPLDIFLEGQERNLTLKLQPLYASGWDQQRYGDRLITFSEWEGNRDAVTEITQEGNINAASHEVISISRDYLSSTAPTDIQAIPIITFEKSVIEGVARYCQALRELNVSGPLFVGIGLINLGKSYLHVGPGHGMGARVHEGGEILPPCLEIQEDTDLSNRQAVARFLRPALDFIWREYNYPGSLNFTQSGDWNVR